MTHTPDDIPATVKALGRLAVPELNRRARPPYAQPCAVISCSCSINFRPLALIPPPAPP